MDILRFWKHSIISWGLKDDQVGWVLFKIKIALGFLVTGFEDIFQEKALSWVFQVKQFRANSFMDTRCAYNVLTHLLRFFVALLFRRKKWLQYPCCDALSWSAGMALQNPRRNHCSKGERRDAWKSTSSTRRWISVYVPELGHDYV